MIRDVCLVISSPLSHRAAGADVVLRTMSSKVTIFQLFGQVPFKVSITLLLSYYGGPE